MQRCMWSEDIEGSDAYAKALQRTGILTETETKEICQGLEKVRAEWAAGEFEVVVSIFFFSFLGISVVYFVSLCMVKDARRYGHRKSSLKHDQNFDESMFT